MTTQTGSSDSDVTLRTRMARPGDAAVLTELVASAYEPHIERIGQKPGPMLDDYSDRIARGHAWVLEADGAVVGVAVLEQGRGALVLDNVAVSPAMQGKGYGRALVAFAEARARSKGAAELQLYTHVLMTENIALYSRLGFVETKRVTEYGFDRVYMTKVLTDAGNAKPT